MVGIRSHQVEAAVPIDVGQSHPPVRVAADLDRCGFRERAIPDAPEQADRFRRAVIDEEIRMTVGVDVLQSHGMRMGGHIHAEL